MKNLKLFLDDDEEDDLQLGLLRLAKDLPAHELFFGINQQNSDTIFQRIKDLRKTGRYNDYCHLRYEAYHAASKTMVQFISNKSTETLIKTTQAELFSSEEDVNYLLPFHREVDYILKTSDNLPEFSLILLPENLAFPVQHYALSADDELYGLIQYYE